jgi:hypothetical protein
VPLLGKQQEVLHLCELSFALDFAIVFLFSFCLLLLFSKKPKPKTQKTSVASVTMLDELRMSFSKLSLNENFDLQHALDINIKYYSSNEGKQLQGMTSYLKGISTQ